MTGSHGPSPEDEVRRPAAHGRGADLPNGLADGKLRAVFERRAMEFATRHTSIQRSETLPILVFTAAQERYGLPLSALAEVLPLGRCTPVPGGPPELVGVINVRGEIRSVFDLARLLQLTPAVDTSGYVLLVRHVEQEVGLRVETVDKIELIDPRSMQSTGDIALAGTHAAVGRTRDRATLLALDELLSKVMAGAAGHASPAAAE